MIDNEKFYNLVSGTGVETWPDYVPDDSTLPAISYVHIAQASRRLKNGQKTSISNTWRLSVVAADTDSLQTALAALEALDNTSNTDYQRIFVLFNTTEARGPEDTFRRAIVDLQTYEA